MNVSVLNLVFLKWRSGHWHQTFQRQMWLFTSVLRPSHRGFRSQLYLSPWGVDGFCATPLPPHPFTLSHPSSMLYANEAGRRALCELQLHLQLCLRLGSCCRKELCCAWVPLGPVSFIHTLYEWRGEEGRFECSRRMSSEQPGSFVWNWLPRARLEPWRKVNRFIHTRFTGVIYTVRVSYWDFICNPRKWKRERRN